MLDDKKDDIFLSRWINDELSSEESRTFESHPEYDYYKKIKDSADLLELSEYNIDLALQNIKSNTSRTTKKPKSIIKLWPYAAVAASIAIIIGMFIFNTNDTFSTNYGEQLAVILPDGSEMILNAKSEASFDEKNWATNRVVTLEGEAYFKVKKGNIFTVTSSNGNVTVLGTQFTVQSTNSFFEATCYEGKVSVASNHDQTILTAGKAYRNIKDTPSEKWSFESTEPSWVHNISSFRSIPLEYVLTELEEQYDLQINRKHLDTKALYTGTFPNDNKAVALKTVFSTLGMQYSLLQNGKTVVVEK